MKRRGFIIKLDQIPRRKEHWYSVYQSLLQNKRIATDAL